MVVSGGVGGTEITMVSVRDHPGDAGAPMRDAVTESSCGPGWTLAGGTSVAPICTVCSSRRIGSDCAVTAQPGGAVRAISGSPGGSRLGDVTATVISRGLPAGKYEGATEIAPPPQVRS